MTYTATKKLNVWKKAKKIKEQNPSKFRKDPYDNILAFDEYGKHTKRGWSIDHIIPKSEGGSDKLENLQAMSIHKNMQLGNTTKKNTRRK